jgi:hypothetical protein
MPIFCIAVSAKFLGVHELRPDKINTITWPWQQELLLGAISAVSPWRVLLDIATHVCDLYVRYVWKKCVYACMYRAIQKKM